MVGPATVNEPLPQSRRTPGTGINCVFSPRYLIVLRPPRYLDMSTTELVTHLKDNLLTCAICDDCYLDPRTLLCLHSFCLRCLQQWSATNGSGESIQCPACRHMTDLGALGGAEGLPRAFFLENLREVVQRFQEIVCVDEPMQCLNCAASNVCKACNVYLCDHCFDKHKQDPTTREHRTVALPETQTIRRERTGSNHRLSRSVSTTEHGVISLHGLFRRSRSSDRAKGSRNRASDVARSADRDTGRPVSFHPNNLTTNARCYYFSQPRLRHTIRGNNRSVWGVAMLSNRIYVITYCASSIDVYAASSYDKVGSISVDGLKDPWDMVSCPRQGCLYICDWRSKCVFAIRPGDYDDREVIRTKWVQMEHRPRGLSVSEDGNSVLIVCADWKKETTSDSLRVYDVTGAKRPRITRKVRLTEFGSVWQAVHEPRPDTYLVCHGGRWDRLHRVCRVDAEGKTRAVYGGDAGHGREQLNIPSSIFVDSQGQVLVADFNNSRVHLLNPDLTLQRHLLSHPDGVDKPRRLCLDEEQGLLFVGQENGEVKIFDVAEARTPVAASYVGSQGH